MNSGCLWGGDLRDCGMGRAGESFTVLPLVPFECCTMSLQYLSKKVIILQLK